MRSSGRCAKGHLIPVCFTSAETGVGVAELAAVIEKVMPSPPEANRPPFRNAAGEPVEIAPDPGGAALAHVFKVSIDAFVGKLGVFRIPPRYGDEGLPALRR